MSLPPLHTLSSALAAALAGEDAEQSLRAALALLAQHDIAPAATGATPWLEVTHGEQKLVLSAPSPPADEYRVVLGHLLGLGLLRAIDQDARRKSQERHDMLSAASFEGILVHIDGVVIDVNQRLAEIAGCKPEDMLGPDTMRRCIAPEDLAATIERVRSGYEGAYKITAQRWDGTRFPAELQSKQGKLGDRPVRIAAVRDITERERTLSLLRASEQHLHDLATGAFDFMVVTQRGVIADIRGAFCEILGYSREQVIGRPAMEFVAEAARALTAQVLAEERPGAYETTLVSVSGEEIPVAVMGVRSTLDGKSARVAGFKDLRETRRLERERRKLEQQLERSQRLDSLGVLAGGIAHDFNNLLVGVIGNAGLLLTTLSNPLDREAAKAILSAGERAASLTRQMLAYAGHQDLARREPVDLGGLLRELRTLLDATLSKKAVLSLELEPNSVVLGDRATLTQVLMNLLTNASDALSDKPGRIVVRSRHVTEPEARFADALGARVGPGNWLVIEISDTGAGMEEATRQRVFEPFFSTKENGHGLGLAACLGIVSSHGGAVLVESEPGRGSCFSLLLPSTERPVTLHPASLDAPTGKPCRVLVIDDEELVRTQLRRTLERQGYLVDEAHDGKSGLAAYEQRPAELLIIDMTMPDMDGAEVVSRLRAAGSPAAIVLSSGYQAQAAAERLAEGAYQVFLPKPYGLRELLAAIEQARSSVAGATP
jgi:two-component system cell cycle sensor histidine kinase/response regulator CckA